MTDVKETITIDPGKVKDAGKEFKGISSAVLRLSSSLESLTDEVSAWRGRSGSMFREMLALAVREVKGLSTQLGEYGDDVYAAAMRFEGVDHDIAVSDDADVKDNFYGNDGLPKGRNVQGSSKDSVDLNTGETTSEKTRQSSDVRDDEASVAMSRKRVSTAKDGSRSMMSSDVEVSVTKVKRSK